MVYAGNNTFHFVANVGRSTETDTIGAMRTMNFYFTASADAPLGGGVTSPDISLHLDLTSTGDAGATSRIAALIGAAAGSSANALVQSLPRLRRQLPRRHRRAPHLLLEGRLPAHQLRPLPERQAHHRHHPQRQGQLGPVRPRRRRPLRMAPSQPGQRLQRNLSPDLPGLEAPQRHCQRLRRPAQHLLPHQHLARPTSRRSPTRPNRHSSSPP